MYIIEEEEEYEEDKDIYISDKVRLYLREREKLLRFNN